MLTEKVALSQHQALGRKYLKTRVANKRRETDQYVCILEREERERERERERRDLN